jgi:hypothetical protein
VLGERAQERIASLVRAVVPFVSYPVTFHRPVVFGVIAWRIAETLCLAYHLAWCLVHSPSLPFVAGTSSVMSPLGLSLFGGHIIILFRPTSSSPNGPL